MFIAIHLDVPDDDTGRDIIETLERILPYMADNVAVGSSRSGDADIVAQLVFPTCEIGTDNDHQYVIYTDQYVK